MLQAVLFDLWETLITDPPERGRPRAGWRAAQVVDALAAHGHTADPVVVLAALDAANRALTLLHDSGRDHDSAGRVDLLLAELYPGGIDLTDAARSALELAITRMPDGMMPYVRPDAADVLAAIKGLGLKTAIVSNAGFTTAPSLRRMLDHYDLSPNLDVLVFSDEACCAKPNASIFESALTQLGVDAAESVFVGDSPLNDIAGAQAVGMFAVQIGVKVRDGITPDARIEALSELIAILKARIGAASRGAV